MVTENISLYTEHILLYIGSNTDVIIKLTDLTEISKHG